MSRQVETAMWAGRRFAVYRQDRNWSAVPGLYVFAFRGKGLIGIDRWHAVYAGKTKNFANRIPTHEDWPEAVRLGATHVHCLIEFDVGKRAAMEREIVEHYQPLLNVQLK